MAGSQKQFVFNGVNGSTGRYFTPPMSIERLAEVARASFSPPEDQERKFLRERAKKPGFFRPIGGIDPKKISESGWGVIFPQKCDPAIVDALKPLLDHRQSEAGDLYRIFQGSDGYATGTGETNVDFLRRFDAPWAGLVQPERMPYYLLLIGGPDEIPFSFQYQLDVNHAVGRLTFDQPEDYANYSRSVVRAETEGVRRTRTMQFFGVCNDGDQATESSSSMLVKPLVRETASFNTRRKLEWNILESTESQAKKSLMRESMIRPDGPAFVFTASHGVDFEFGDARQLPYQGALLCQDWPGPYHWSGEIPNDFFLSGEDIGADADVHGLISFHFACFGAGTPEFDDYLMDDRKARARIAPKSFVGALPKRLLSHPRGGALACVGHIDRAWTFSFESENVQSIAAFRNSTYLLMEGTPIGDAMEGFQLNFAQVATEITRILESDRGKPASARTDPEELVWPWVQHNDARSYMILGDPAVRLMPDKLGRKASASEPEPAVIVTRPAKPGDGAGGKKDKKKSPDKLKAGGHGKDGQPKPEDPKKKKGSKSGEKSGKSSQSDQSNAFGTSGYSDITNYLFVDPETGRRVTVTVSGGVEPESWPYQAAWQHVSTATKLLEAHDVQMGEAVRDDEGRLLLTASYVVGEGEELIREHFGVLRLSDGRCVQFQLSASTDDSSAAHDLRAILDSVRSSAAKGPSQFSVRPARRADGKQVETIGGLSMELPGELKLQGPRQFLSADGRKRIEIDFGDRRTEEGAKAFGLPEIGPRSQFVKVEQVSRFLRSPIRFEASTFPVVGPHPGAVAFGSKKPGSRTAEVHPTYSTSTRIGGYPAELRYFADEVGGDSKAKAEIDEFLEFVK
ncbi:hypothetical protein GC170_09570 [bacterium]|nr:hypothetical protein [bacterium]